MVKNTALIDRLMAWYADQCDGDWEHSYGLALSTLDNPGWRLQIDLTQTYLEGKSFVEVSNLEPDIEWYRCWVEDKC